MKRYFDKNGVVMYARRGLGENFMTFREHHRVKSPALPVRLTLEEAQADLDAYALKNGLKEYAHETI